MPSQVQRLTYLLAIAGLLAVSADFACNDDSCPSVVREAAYVSLAEIERQGVEPFDAAVARLGFELSADEKVRLARDGHLIGVLPLDRPVKQPDGAVEMPKGWLPEIPEGHPWRARLTTADDAFYSWFEERVLDARLYDAANPEHREFAAAYLSRQQSASPKFTGWTFSSPTECPKKKVVK